MKGSRKAPFLVMGHGISLATSTPYTTHYTYMTRPVAQRVQVASVEPRAKQITTLPDNPFTNGESITEVTDNERRNQSSPPPL